jgi:hypothetical protein
MMFFSLLKHALIFFKNEPLPTIKFIQNKSEQLLAAENEIKASEKPPKLLITREDLGMTL